jgi:hypothetical protein
MDPVVVGYVVYIAVTVVLTVCVAHALSRYGRVYLADVFHNERVGTALNQLLVVGFYLINFGFAALFLRTGAQITSFRDVLAMLSVKLGTVLLVVGALHLVNLLIFSRIRHNARMAELLREPARPLS